MAFRRAQVRGGMDIEVRYTLERGVSGFYTYAEYTHPASYPPAGEGESRFILQMNPTFNWISVDKDRNQLMIANGDSRSGVVIHAKEQSIILDGVYKNSVEHKYSYCAVMDKLTAWGWSSTKDHIGVYFINPSNEYIGGGPEKLDLVAHMGATLLDYWTSGHYAGGSGNNIPAWRELEACRRPRLRLLQFSGRSQGPVPRRVGQAEGHLRQRHAGRARGMA
jgi:rhamnogalacturonan endolyase